MEEFLNGEIEGVKDLGKIKSYTLQHQPLSKATVNILLNPFDKKLQYIAINACYLSTKR